MKDRAMSTRNSSLPGFCRSPRAVAAVLLALMGLLLAPAARAQQISIIRDAEIETMVKNFAAPLLKAAGLRGLTAVHIVADRQFNAFVVEDGSLFINYGTILDSPTPNALKAVLAHEIGHVAGGHLARIRERAETLGRMQAVAMILGIGALAASAGSDNGQIGGMASAFILASQSAGVNALMSYRQSEESAADAAALKFLAATHQSAKGLVDTFKFLQSTETAGFSPYLRTHPLAQDRITSVETQARRSPYWSAKDSSADIGALALAKAKLSGFLEGQKTVLNRFPNSDRSAAARYARIIAAYKAGGGVGVVPQMAALAAGSPSNPYFQEMLGQMYFETGNASKALPPLAKAVKLAPGQTLIRMLYGQALVGAGGKANLEEAVLQLARATNEDRKSISARRVLAQAYEQLGRRGEATLVAAEIARLSGNMGTALGLARKALSELPPGSPAATRAQDILSSQ